MAQNSIRKQTLDILTRSETTALALHSRVGDFNRRRLLPAIERILEDFALPGRRVSIERLEIDLGSIPLDRFEEVALERLEHELRRVLARHLREGTGGDRAGVTIEPEDLTPLRLLDQYLVQGTLPFWSPRNSVFSVQEFLLELIEREPAGLIETIKNRGHQPYVIERLVTQLDETVLLRLLGIVAPEQSVLIRVYIEDLRRLHHDHPVLTLGDREFSRLLWFLTLSYLLLDHGSQFNRKSFVKTILEGIAESTGLEYRKILAALVIGVDRTEKTHSLKSSLPAVIRELVREANFETDALDPGRATGRDGLIETASGRLDEIGSESDRTSEDLRLAEYFLVRGMFPATTSHNAIGDLEDLVFRLAGNSPEQLAALLLDHGRDAATVKRLSERLGEAALFRVLYILEPFNAELIATYLSHLRGVHRETPLIPIPERPFGELIWQLTLTYLVNDPGSQFNRKSFVRSLLEGLAKSENIPFPDILAILFLALREMHRKRPPRSSLPSVVDGLVTELADQFLELADAAPELRRPAPGSFPADQPPSPRQSPVETPELSDEPFSPAFRRFLNDPLSASETDLTESPPGKAFTGSSLRELVLQAHADGGMNSRAAAERLLGEHSLESLIAALTPDFTGEFTEFLEIASFALARVIATGRRSGELAAQAILEALLDNAAGPNPPTFDRTVRLVTAKLSDKLGVSFKRLAENLIVSLRGTRRTPASKAIERALLIPEQRPRPSDPSRPVTWHDAIEAIRHHLRFGVLPWDTRLREPEPTADQLLSKISGFPRSVLEFIFSGEVPATRSAMIRRAVQTLPDEGFQRLLFRLLPGIPRENSPFRDSLAASEASATNLVAFRARLLEAALDGLPLDLEAFAETAETETDPSPDARTEVRLLKSALAERYRTGESVHFKAIPTDELLATLTSLHPVEARQFLRALRDAPTARAALLQQTDEVRFSAILTTLSPDDAPLLEIVITGLSGMTDVFPGVSPQRIREVFFLELVRLGEGTRVNERFFVQILRKLFRPPLNDQARDRLTRLKEEAHNNPRLSRVAVAALSRSVDFLGAIGQDTVFEDFPPSDEETETDEFPRTIASSVLLLLADETPETTENGERPPLSDDGLRHAVLELIRENPARVYEFLRVHLPEPRARENWIRRLPESVLGRFVHLLSPSSHPWLLDAAELLLSAWKETIPGERSTTARRWMWDFILAFLADAGDAPVPIETFIARYLQRLAEGREASPPAIKAVLNRFAELARELGRGKLVAILHRHRDRIITTWSPAGGSAVSGPSRPERSADPPSRTPGKPTKGKTSFRLGDEEKAMTLGVPIYIGNAGLVLTSPFLPNFLQSLDYLVPDGEKGLRFRDAEALSRAVHMTQYLVDQKTATPEPLLVLNKILCGVPPETPVEPEIVPTEKEIEMADLLLRSMIANWKVLSGTSITGLRETFFQREGRLEACSDKWEVTVQRKTLDVLVDQIPWGFSIIFHRWMPKPVFVTW